MYIPLIITFVVLVAVLIVLFTLSRFKEVMIGEGDQRPASVITRGRMTLTDELRFIKGFTYGCSFVTLICRKPFKSGAL